MIKNCAAQERSVKMRNDYYRKHCPVCGAEEPTMAVYDVTGDCLGCEVCLTIYDEGRIRL